ncbi:CPBP family intramembrane metalloprotease [candidate division KSB1 bacterium]|nr:CPBP family intramembrane metalloprotease [candidate division KSB1 bacterium]
MKIKKYQQQPLQKDFRVGIILVALLSLAFGLYLVDIGISALATLLSFAAFVLFVAPYVLAGNPALIKVLRSDSATSPNRIWLAALLLWALVQIFALATRQFAFTHAIISGTWLGILAFLVLLLPQRQAPHALDYLLVLLIWLPIEIGLLHGVSIPPARGLVNPLELVGLVVLIYAYLVVRTFEVGFSYRLSGEDYRVVILDFIVFFLIAIIVGMLTGFLSIARHMPSFTDLLIRLAAIFFFIALPEELLFRGVIYKLLEKQFKGKHRVRTAMIVSSVIFGLAHSNNRVAPFLTIEIGGRAWDIPWVYVLLATVAGFFYCFVFIRTKKITAAAAIHLLVDWAWYAFFD